jgi:hypothetical protein
MTALADRWERASTVSKAVVVVVALLVALNILGAAADELVGGDQPGGPTSSSYATGDDGVAAYASLLARAGHPVGRARVPLSRVPLAAAFTVVVLDPDTLGTDPDEHAGDEVGALLRFVTAGGRLVLGGGGGAPELTRRLPAPPTWSGRGVTTAHPLVPAPETSGVERVVTGGAGSWPRAGATLPILGGSRPLATVTDLGRGRIVLLADTSPLQNAWLGRADDAAFGLAIAGPPGRPVVFAESVHGFDDRSGLKAIPARWRWVALLLLGATLAYMWSRGRRLGPPEDAERAMAPPRRAYVDAVAATLARTRDRAVALAPVQRAAREQLLARAGVDITRAGDDATVRAAAQRLGVADGDVAVLLTPPGGNAETLALGRVLAELTKVDQ